VTGSDITGQDLVEMGQYARLAFNIRLLQAKRQRIRIQPLFSGLQAKLMCQGS
jgi:hypothetical protein